MYVWVWFDHVVFPSRRSPLRLARFNMHKAAGAGCKCCDFAGESYSCTVAILAQGTSWAVAVTQAFFARGGGRWKCRARGCSLRHGAARQQRLGAAFAQAGLAMFGSVCRLEDVLCFVFWRGRLASTFRFILQFVKTVGSRSQAGCLKRNTAMDDSIGGS